MQSRSTRSCRRSRLLKYEQATRLGGWFAAQLAGVVAKAGGNLHADVVLPVPLHPARQRKRVYNQAELIVRPLAHRLGPKPGPHLLVRIETLACPNSCLRAGSAGNRGVAPTP
jgi:predicted amidophosphoribosyltransferase